jgi:hypothetical protein
MKTYKIAIEWSNGVFRGYTGYGHTEDSAKDNALSAVFQVSATTNRGFKIIDPDSIKLLPESCVKSIKDDWEWNLGSQGH